MEEGHTAAVRQPGMCLRLEDPSESLAGRFHMAQGGEARLGLPQSKADLAHLTGPGSPDTTCHRHATVLSPLCLSVNDAEMK